MADAHIKIDHNTDMVRNAFGELITRLGAAAEKETENVAHLFKNEIKKYLNKNQNSKANLGQWNNHLGSSIRISDVTSDGFEGKGVFIDYENNGVNIASWHEYADSGHWVDVDSAPMLRSWMQDKGFETEAMSYLYVEPHPFVKPVSQRASARIREHIDEHNSIGELIDEVF